MHKAEVAAAKELALGRRALAGREAEHPLRLGIRLALRERALPLGRVLVIWRFATRRNNAARRTAVAAEDSIDALVAARPHDHVGKAGATDDTCTRFMWWRDGLVGWWLVDGGAKQGCSDEVFINTSRLAPKFCRLHRS